MKIIITGGTGLIGSALVNALLPEQHEIIVTSRGPEKVKTLPSAVKVVKWDSKTRAGWGEYVNGADAIVNLAGESLAPLPWWLGNRKATVRASRVNAGRAIVDAIQNAKIKPRTVIQASAIGYYGIHGDETLTENSPAGNDFLASVCVDWEAATAPVEAMGVRRAIYRTGLVLALEHALLLPLMALPFRFFVGGKVGSGRQWMSWIHIADEIAGLRYLIENEDARGAFNFTTPNPVRNQDFAQALGKALKRPAAVPVPAFALKIPLGEMADLVLLNGQRVVPERLEKSGFQFRFATIQDALKNLYQS
jgi:uncharacterized protein (TIGR01777 family)